MQTAYKLITRLITFHLSAQNDSEHSRVSSS